MTLLTQATTYFGVTVVALWIGVVYWRITGIIEERVREM